MRLNAVQEEKALRLIGTLLAATIATNVIGCVLCALSSYLAYLLGITGSIGDT